MDQTRLKRIHPTDILGSSCNGSTPDFWSGKKGWIWCAHTFARLRGRQTKSGSVSDMVT